MLVKIVIELIHCTVDIFRQWNAENALIFAKYAGFLF